MDEERARPARRHSFEPLLFAPREPLFAGRQPEPLPDDAPRRRHDSHVRLRAGGLLEPARGSGLEGRIEWLEAQDLLGELDEDHRTLACRLASLADATSERPRDPATRAALRSFDARLEELGTIRDVLAIVQRAAEPRSVHRALLPDAPLAEYLRGLYAWLFAVVRALERLAAGLQIMQPDWASHRRRIEEARNFHFDELEDAIVEELELLFSDAADQDAVTELAVAFDVLLACARQLEVRLDERFG